MPCVINKDTWNKIPARDQQIMMDLAPAGADVSHKALADLNTLSWQEMDDFGMRVTPTKEEAALWEEQFRMLWDEWLAQNEANGITEANEILNWWRGESGKAWAK